MADPKEMAERLRTTLEQMATNCSVGMGIWDKHSNAVLEAATLIERLTVEQLAGVIREAAMEWLKNGGEGDSPEITARALLDHLTTGTEVQG